MGILQSIGFDLIEGYEMRKVMAILVFLCDSVFFAQFI
jgi:hypothetical protein